MILELDYSGHYDRKFVEITLEEWKKIKQLTKNHYLTDTSEGQDLLAELEKRKEVDMKFESVVAYI